MKEVQRGSASGAEPFAVPLVRVKKRRPVLEIVDDPVLEIVDDPLDVDIGFLSETNFFTGFGDDVCDGGLFVATYQPLPVGTELTLSFVLPGGAEVMASGRVTWTREPLAEAEVTPGMGVSFTWIDEAAVHAIRRYAELRSPIFYSD